MTPDDRVVRIGHSQPYREVRRFRLYHEPPVLDDRAISLAIGGVLLMVVAFIGSSLSYHLPLEPRRAQPDGSTFSLSVHGPWYGLACPCPRFGRCEKAQAPSVGQIKRGECPPEFGNGKEHQ